MSRLPFFRKRKRAIWQELARQLEGAFVPGTGWRKHDAVIAKVDDWTIILETYKKGKTLGTRIRAPYVNRDSFYFRIFRKKAFSGVQKRLGMQDLEVGWPNFDDPFIIQSNDVRKVQMLFTPERIRQLISWQPAIFLENDPDEGWMTDTWGEGTSELTFSVPGVITQLEQLHDLYELFAEVLNHLCHIGSAYRDDPLI